MLALVLTLFAVSFGLLLLSLRALAVTGVPVKAADAEAIEAALALLDLKEGEVILDLGCGKGDVLKAARRRPGVRAVGYELNPFAWAVAWVRFAGDRGVSVRLGDFRKARLPTAAAAYAYLMPAAMPKVGAVLSRQLPGARLAAVDFAVPGWEPLAKREVGPLLQPIYLYRVPGSPGVPPPA